MSYSFGNEIKKIRDSKNISLEEMANRLNSFAKNWNESHEEMQFPDNLSKSQVWKWENNKTEPRLDTTRLISYWSGVPSDQLLGLSKPDKTAPDTKSKFTGTLAAHAADRNHEFTSDEVDRIIGYLDGIIDADQAKKKNKED